jgi:hypothetical protein
MLRVVLRTKNKIKVFPSKIFSFFAFECLKLHKYFVFCKPSTYDGAVVGVAARFSHSGEQGAQILASGGQEGSHLSVRDIHDSVRVNDVGLPPGTRVVDPSGNFLGWSDPDTGKNESGFSPETQNLV